MTSGRAKQSFWTAEGEQQRRRRCKASRASERARFTASGNEEEGACVVCTCTLTAVNF
jgi:hypothetical protein